MFRICLYFVLDRPVLELSQIMIHSELTLQWSFFYADGDHHKETHRPYHLKWLFMCYTSKLCITDPLCGESPPEPVIGKRFSGEFTCKTVWVYSTKNLWDHDPTSQNEFCFTCSNKIQSCRNFAHVTAAELSWHVQNCGMIKSLYTFFV